MEGLFQRDQSRHRAHARGERLRACRAPAASAAAVHCTRTPATLRPRATLARRNIAAFERSSADYIVVNAAGCGAMMKEYGHLLADDPAVARPRGRGRRARARRERAARRRRPADRAAPLEVTVTYDAPCHLLHAQRIAAPPLARARRDPRIELVPLDGSEHCCGSAGIYNLVEPDVSDTVLAPKLAHIADTRAALVATGNPGLPDADRRRPASGGQHRASDPSRRPAGCVVRRRRQRGSARELSVRASARARSACRGSGDLISRHG